jgi:putative glutamine amidotransferase
LSAKNAFHLDANDLDYGILTSRKAKICNDLGALVTQSVRPRIAILGRFAENTSATRRDAIVTALRLAEAVYAAGGEPMTLLPVAGSNWDERLAGFQGVLLPGGGDINPRTYGQESQSDEIYGVHDLQDAADISLANWAIDRGVPLLSICRGTQIVNVATGGTLVQHMDEPHRHHVHDVTIESHGSDLGLTQPTVESSCYHHQMLDRLGDGLEVIARSAEGTIEAVSIRSKGWAFGVQWHPEDNWNTDDQQAKIFEKFVSEAAKAKAI